MQRKTRSILEELDTFRSPKDRENLVESRANHVIQGAINLINFICFFVDNTAFLFFVML